MRFFERLQLEVELKITGSSVEHIKQLERGQLDIGHQAADHIIRAVDGGSDLFMFMGINRPCLSLVVQQDVKSFLDLKSKVLGVDGTATGFALLLKELLRRNGLNEIDYALKPIGGSQNRFEALISGSVEGALLDPPYDLKAVEQNYRVLAKTTDHFPNVQGSVAAARRDWAQNNSDVLVRYIRGYIQALDWLIDVEHRAPAAEILTSALNIDAHSAQRIYEEYVARNCTFCHKGQLMPSALKNLIQLMGRPGAEHLNFSDYVDLSFMQKAGKELDLD